MHVLHSSYIQVRACCSPTAVCCCPAGKRALKKVQPILGGFNKEDYATQRLWTKVWKHAIQLSLEQDCCA
jgi:hypothetical protein